MTLYSYVVRWDFGFAPNAVQIGDYVWIDKNDNGIQDDGGGSAGIPNIKLTISKTGGSVSRNTRASCNRLRLNEGDALFAIVKSVTISPQIDSV